MDKSMYRHHYSRGVPGTCLSETFDILYRYPHKKIKSKIIENLQFCIQDIFITWA